MSILSLRLPDSLHERVKEFAQKEGISMNQFISSAVYEKMSAFSTKNYLAKRASKADEVKFKEAISKIPDVEPEPYDKL